MTRFGHSGGLAHPHNYLTIFRLFKPDVWRVADTANLLSVHPDKIM